VKPLYKNILLVAGDGRNVGKTSLALTLIKKFSKQGIYAIKVSPHFHHLQKDEHILYTNDQYQILEELNTERLKDSSRFLKAGAKRVFYIQTCDENLMESFLKVLSILPPDVPLLAEAGGLVHYIKAGLFLFVQDNKQLSKNRHIAAKADVILNKNYTGLQTWADHVEWLNDQWILKTN